MWGAMGWKGMLINAAMAANKDGNADQMATETQAKQITRAGIEAVEKLIVEQLKIGFVDYPNMAPTQDKAGLSQASDVQLRLVSISDVTRLVKFAMYIPDIVVGGNEADFYGKFTEFFSTLGFTQYSLSSAHMLGNPDMCTSDGSALRPFEEQKANGVFTITVYEDSLLAKLEISERAALAERAARAAKAAELNVRTP